MHVSYEMGSLQNSLNLKEAVGMETHFLPICFCYEILGILMRNNKCFKRITIDQKKLNWGFS